MNGSCPVTAVPRTEMLRITVGDRVEFAAVAVQMTY
jgi:hypothetical protein